MSALAPGSIIGILGGGQLGRMLALAAAELGFDVHIFTPEVDSPAARVAARTTLAAYDDEAALAHFAASVDVVTAEFENVPADAALRLVETGVPVRPGPLALAVAQDRIDEKRYLNACGVKTVEHVAVDDLAGLEAGLARLGLPAVLKTRRLGYDGKGQAWIRAMEDAPAAFQALGGRDLILEAAAPFVAEASIIAARGLMGAFAAYDLCRNRHEDGILAETKVPSGLDQALDARAKAAIKAVMDNLDYVGVLALELFVLADGTLLANEIAPRVHNSGHWTIEACHTSQFAQHIRAVAGWPLGSTARIADATMTNLIGPHATHWRDFAQEPAARLHFYGKRDARPGRKMGHVTRIFPLSSIGGPTNSTT